MPSAARMFFFKMTLVLSSLSPVTGQTKHLLLTGVTGAGKSTLGNTLLGQGAFQVGTDLDSCTGKASHAKGVLFGDSSSNTRVIVSDTGGLGDTEGRDEEFTDDVAAHVRSLGGAHGIIYVHNACNQKLDMQSRKTLAAMVNTLTNNTTKKEIGSRLSVIMTQCTDSPRQAIYERSLPPLMCKHFDLCNVPIFWYDDFHPSASQDSWLDLLSTTITEVLMGNTQKVSWRTSFANWVRDLSTTPANVPSETEREILKREHRESSERLEKERRAMQGQLKNLEVQLKTLADAAQQNAREKEDLLREIRDLKEKMAAVSVPSGGCFSPFSQVIDRKLGSISVKDLQVGSQVLTSNGWTTVTTYLHWHPDEEVDALQIVHEQGELTVTPEHILFTIDTHGAPQSILAKQLNPGELLLAESDSSSMVDSINPTKMQGYYAPITSAGTILVDNVVASCYAQDDRFNLPHWAINLFMMPIRMLPQWLSYFPDAGEVHPYARFLMWF